MLGYQPFQPFGANPYQDQLARMQPQSVTRVSGIGSARQLRLPPNSSMFALDYDDEHVYAVFTDGAGVIRIKKPGLYNVFFNATPAATAAGAVEFAMRHNGAVVPGANGSVQLAAVGDAGNVAFMSPVTVECGAGDTLAFFADAATSVTTAAAIVEKVA